MYAIKVSDDRFGTYLTSIEYVIKKSIANRDLSRRDEEYLSDFFKLFLNMVCLLMILPGLKAVQDFVDEGAILKVIKRKWSAILFDSNVNFEQIDKVSEKVLRI